MPRRTKCRVEYCNGFMSCNVSGTQLEDEVVYKPEQMRKESSTNPGKIKIGKTKIQDIDEVFLINVLSEIETLYITAMLKREKISCKIIEESSGQCLSILRATSSFCKSIYVDKADYQKAVAIIESYKTKVGWGNNTWIKMSQNSGIFAVKLITGGVALIGILYIVIMGTSIFY